MSFSFLPPLCARLFMNLSFLSLVTSAIYMLLAFLACETRIPSLTKFGASVSTPLPIFFLNEGSIIFFDDLSSYSCLLLKRLGDASDICFFEAILGKLYSNLCNASSLLSISTEGGFMTDCCFILRGR